MKLAVYYDLAYGGAANALRLFIAHLREHHRVDVFHPPGAWPIGPRTIPLPGITPPKTSRNTYWNRISLPWHLRKLERLERTAVERFRAYDRTLVHSCRLRGAPVLLSLLGRDSAFYVTEPLRLYREPRPLDGEARWIWNMARLVYTPVSRRLNQADQEHGSNAHRVFANSKYTATQVQAIYNQAATVVYPPVDPAFLETSLGEGGGGYLLSPGALIPQKGHGRVIRAVAQLPRPRPPVLLAGTPVNRRYVRRMAALADRLGVSIQVREDLSQTDYIECLRGARAVAVGALREPFGLVSLEAQAVGRPVVVVHEGGLPETICDADSRYVVAPDPEPFAQGLQMAIMQKDFDGHHARGWVSQTFSPQRCGDDLEAVLCA